MARRAKKTGREEAAFPPVAPETLTALVDRLRDLTLDTPVAEARAAVGADAAAVPAAAAALIGSDERIVLMPLAALARLPEFTATVIQALGRQRSVVAAQGLQIIAGQATDRDTLKAARRALHVLESQGVHIHLPPPAGATTVFRPPPAAGIAWEGALAGPFDAEGYRSLLLARKMHPVGAHLAISILSERQGLLLFQAIRQTHRQLDKEWQEYLGDSENNMTVEIPFGYAQWLLSEAAERLQASGTELPDSYTAWRDVTGGPEAGASPRLIYEEAAVDPAAPPAGALQRGAELLDEPELEAWSLPLEALTGPGVELLSTRASPLVLSEAAQVARERQLAGHAADEQFNTEVRGLYTRRLEETALLVQHSERAEQAQAALATAVALGDPEVTPAEIPFAVALAQRSLEAAEAAAPTTAQGRIARSRLVSTGEVFPALEEPE